MASFTVKVSDEDKGMSEAIKWWTGLEDQEVVGGILEKDAFELTYPTESNTAPEITLVTKAVVHEFGSKGGGRGGRIPQRAPIRNGTKLAEPDIKVALEKGMAKVSSQSLLLGLLGMKLVRGIRRAVDQLSTPALSKETVDNKGHTTILKDSKQLYNAYDYEVRRRRD